MIDKTTPHVPVLCSEVLEMLAITSDGIYIDATFGAGGMTRAILARQPKKLIGVDRDSTARKTAEILQGQYKNFEFINNNFGMMQHFLKDYDKKIDGIVFDLGVSSMQLDDAARGFSFAKDAPLDMRMNQAEATPTAADIINQQSEIELANIFYRYGEEKKSRWIAKKIVAQRAVAPITTTLQLSALISDAVQGARGKIHPATRVFQALRIAVNNELTEVVNGLEAAEKLLKIGGRLVVISFHSLEDKIVKTFLKDRATAQARPSRHMPDKLDNPTYQPSFELLSKKPVVASDAEQQNNPRSRSAKLRFAIKIA